MNGVFECAQRLSVIQASASTVQLF